MDTKIGGSLYVSDIEICHRKNIPHISNKDKVYHIESRNKIVSQGMTSTVYSYVENKNAYIIKHSDKEYMSESELINSVGIQIAVNKMLNLAPEVIDFFICDGKTRQCVTIMKLIGSISYFDHMKHIIKSIKRIDKIDAKCTDIYKNILHFYSSIKLCNYIMNYQMGIVHGDLHRGNIQLDVDEQFNISKIYYIDFDYSTQIYDEYETLSHLKGIDRLNFISRYNNLINKNNLHISKMVLDYCNELMTTLSLYSSPFGTPLTMPNSIKITSSDDIHATLYHITHHFSFKNSNPTCGLLILLMLIYDNMYVQYTIAPFLIGKTTYFYPDAKTARISILDEMKNICERDS
jgi:hypothetical protein